MGSSQHQEWMNQMLEAVWDLPPDDEEAENMKPEDWEKMARMRQEFKRNVKENLSEVTMAEEYFIPGLSILLCSSVVFLGFSKLCDHQVLFQRRPRPLIHV